MSSMSYEVSMKYADRYYGMVMLRDAVYQSAIIREFPGRSGCELKLKE